MKKIVAMVLLYALFLVVVGCQQQPAQEYPMFTIPSMSTALGGDEGLKESWYTYDISITSEQREIKDIQGVNLVYSDPVQQQLTKEEPMSLSFFDDYAQVEGKFFFNTDGMSKDEIMAMEPLIVAIEVILHDGSTYTIE